MSILRNTLILMLSLQAVSAAAVDGTSYQRDLLLAARAADSKFVADAARGAAWFADTHGCLRQPQTAHSFDAAFPGSDAVFGSNDLLLGTQAGWLSALWVEVVLLGCLLR